MPAAEGVEACCSLTRRYDHGRILRRVPIWRRVARVGLTSADALRDAELWSDRTLPALTSYGLDGPRGETCGAYYLRPCTQELYEAVQAGAEHPLCG